MEAYEELRGLATAISRGKPGTAADSLPRTIGGSNLATASDREFTTLEKCRNQAMNNMYAINDLGSRVAALLERLRGPQLTGGSGSEGESEPRGMLVVHLEQLEYEGQRLGEIQADLALLEQLL